MVSVWLIVVTVILLVVLLIVNTYILAVYCHVDDRGFGASLFCKFLVVVGMTISWGMVLMLPLDVANSRGEGGGFDMKTFWYIALLTTIAFLTILLPFALFFYETDDEKSFFSRLGTAFCFTIVGLIIIALLYGITYIFLRRAYIPVKGYSQSVDLFTPSADPIAADFAYGSSVDSELEISVSVPIYMIAITTFLGWFLFILFGGIGLFGIGIDLMSNYKFRSTMKNKQDVIARQKEIRAAVEELIEQGNHLKDEKQDAKIAKGFFETRKANNRLNRDLNRFTAAVYTLENDFEILKLELNIKNTHPIVFIIKCLLGVIFIGIAVVWLVHLLLFNIIRNNEGVPASTFLNAMLISIEEHHAGFVSTALFALLCLFLLWAAHKGNIKFGLRIPFCCRIHPMKVNDTMMNSFLFNVMMILICTLPIVEFSNQAFTQYTRLTTVDTIFGNQIKYLNFFKYFFKYNVFIIAFFAWSILAGIIQAFLPAPKPLSVKKLEELKKQKFRV